MIGPPQAIARDPRIEEIRDRTQKWIKQFRDGLDNSATNELRFCIHLADEKELVENWILAIADLKFLLERAGHPVE